jgi:hypothetical protein
LRVDPQILRVNLKAVLGGFDVVGVWEQQLRAAREGPAVVPGDPEGEL